MSPTWVYKWLLVMAVFFAIPVFAHVDPPTVAQVDITRYMGRWYEIAAFPQPFERNCFAAQADYTLLPDGKVAVVNSCNKGSLTGPLSSVKGTARIVDPATNAKLKVSFFWPITGDYWILAVDDQYQSALVGSPSRKYLWILSRSRSMPQEKYQALVTRARELGFDVEKLRPMPQPKP